MSHDRRHRLTLSKFEQDREDDPAATVSQTKHSVHFSSALISRQDFTSKLQNHLLGRLLQRDFDSDDHEDFTDADRNCIRLVGNTFFSARRLQINYTTYDVRRARDSLNPTGQCNVMVRAPQDLRSDHPYWYARILGVFHTQVLCIPQAHCDPQIPTLYEPKHMDFLWVRWYGNEPDYVSGSQAARLHKIGFVPSRDQGAFGFLDPSLIIRACHLIPSFVDGKTNLLLRQGPSAGRSVGDILDWTNFYVGRYAGSTKHLTFPLITLW